MATVEFLTLLLPVTGRMRDGDWFVLCLQVSATANTFVLRPGCGYGGGLRAHLSRALPWASL